MARANPCGQYGTNVPKPPSDPCYGKVCPPGTICVDGICVSDPVDPCYGVNCGPNQICVNGVCVDYDPCANVTCPTGQICKDGLCVPDPDYVEPPPPAPDRAALFDRTQLGSMPPTLQSLVNECMDKWERFIKPNARYTVETHPNGLVQIDFDATTITPGAFASMSPRSYITEYPYQFVKGTLRLGTGWSQLTTRADQLETILHELGHALGFSCVHSFGNFTGIPIHNNGLIFSPPSTHYANLLNLWNQKSGTSGTYLPINDSAAFNNPGNYDAHWYAYTQKTVDNVLYKGVKNDIMCPGTKMTPDDINIITDLTLEHARTLGYEVIGVAEGEPDFTPLRSDEEYRLFGNCVSYE